MNHTLKQYLHCFTFAQPKRWMEWLSWVEYGYNIDIHSSNKLSPFKVVPGRTKVQVVEVILRELQQNLLEAQVCMEAKADLHHHKVIFKVGNYVFLWLQPYRQKSVAFLISLKFSPRFFRTFIVHSRIGMVEYKLAQIHDVFHVNLLKKK